MLGAVAEPTPSPMLPDPQEHRIRRSWWLFAGSFLGIAALVLVDVLAGGLRPIDLLLLLLLGAAAFGAYVYRAAVDRAEAGRRAEVETFARILQGLSRSVSPDSIVGAIVEELGAATGADHIVVARRRPDSRVLEATLVSTHPGVPSSTTVLPISDLEAPVLTARRSRADEADPYRMAIPIPIEPDPDGSPDLAWQDAAVSVGDHVGAGAAAPGAVRAPGRAASVGSDDSRPAAAASASAAPVASTTSATTSASSVPAASAASASSTGSADPAAWPPVGPGTIRSSWRSVVGSLGPPRNGDRGASAHVGSAIPERRYGQGALDQLVVATAAEPGPAEQVAERIALRVRDVYGLRNVLAAPLRVRDDPIGAVIISRRTDEPWSEASRRVLRGAAVEASAALSRAYSHRRAETEASTDALTGLPNRRYFDEYCALLARRRRRSDAVGVLMIDIDRFKRLNDRYGHAVGDHVLQAVGGAIGSAIRDDDVPARYGGEEFAVVLRNPSRAIAIEVAERIRTAVGRIDTGRLGVPGVTVSVGVAVAEDPDEAIGLIVERADRALYRAKHAGRDRVVAA